MAATTDDAAGPLYHLVQEELWAACKAEGRPYYPPTYEQDGFIHLTKDPAFLLGVANHFYQQVPGRFLLLVLDPAKLTAKVVFEPAAPVGSTPSAGLLAGAAGEAAKPLFPHLYGSIVVEAVGQELLVQRGDDGSFLSIEGL